MSRSSGYPGATAVIVVTGASGGVGRAVAREYGRRGYRGQQTDEPADPDRPANLWQPADGPREPDYGAHGRFDDRSRPRSVQLWASQHHGLVATGLAVTATAAVTALRLRRRGAA